MAGLKPRDRNLGIFLLGWDWTAWGQIYRRARAGPVHAWVDFPCFCLRHDSALWLCLSPWQVGRPQGAHLSFGGGQGKLGSGLALGAWTVTQMRSVLQQKDSCPQCCAGHLASAARSPGYEGTLGSAGGCKAGKKVSHCYCCLPSCALYLVAKWGRAPHFRETRPSLCHALCLSPCPDPFPFRGLSPVLFRDLSPGPVRAPSLSPALCLSPGPFPSLCHVRGLFRAHVLKMRMCLASCLCARSQQVRWGRWCKACQGRWCLPLGCR